MSQQLATYMQFGCTVLGLAALAAPEGPDLWQRIAVPLAMAFLAASAGVQVQQLRQKLEEGAKQKERALCCGKTS